MMNYEDLIQLRRRTNGSRMLSVYLPGAAPDPALREAPDVLFEAELSRIHHAIADSSHEDRQEFLAASEHATRWIHEDPLARQSAGVAVFADAQGVRYAGALLEEPPVVVEWKNGIVIAPYLRTASLSRVAIVTLIDSRRARLLRYREGHLEAIEEIAAEIHTEAPLHMGDAPRASFHQGVRGMTGTDEVERREAAAFDRMLGILVHRLETLAQGDSWLIIGGMTQSAHKLVSSLPRGFTTRLQLVHALTVTSTDAEISAAAADAVAELLRRRDGVLVELVLDRGRAGGRASLGWQQTMVALEERAASEVLVSAHVAERTPGRADAVATLAMDGGAHVEVVPGDGADRLDAESEGVAAELRFPVPFASLPVNMRWAQANR
jgi:release factor family 10